ncbi:MAG: hypothetical protein AAB534_03350 [Patescibacteria group bacterium]
MEDLKQLIKDTYQNLPEDLQQAVMNPSLKNRLEDIGRKNNLNEAQVQALKNETYFVLLALETISDFQTNLDKQINLGEEIAGKIALSVYDGIFKPVEITLLAIEQIIKEKEEEDGIVPEETKNNEDKEQAPTITPSSQKEISRPKDWPREKPEFQSMKSMIAPREMQIQKVNEEVTPSRGKDAAIEETLRRAKAEMEGGDVSLSGQNLSEISSSSGSDDFKWPDDVAGVRIENKSEEDPFTQNENSENGGEENLNKATVLEEIEHPPAYMSSAFEKKMQKTAPQQVVPPKNKPDVVKYGQSDPYREPTN